MNLLNHKTSLVLLFFALTATNISNAQEGNVTINQSNQITTLLNAKKEMNRNETDSNRYKIQVYSGNRSGAQTAKEDFLNAYSQWHPVMHYETPNFKVWAGNFSSRLEADRALKRIKKKFANAFIFKPKKTK